MNIWIDLTDLKSWRDNCTGIQRVVYNIAARYARTAGVRFFRFSKKHSRFFEYPFSRLDERQASAEKKSPKKWSNLINKLRGAYQAHQSVSFARNDLVLVFGAIWVKPETLTKLIQLKDAQGFKLIILVYDLIPFYAPHLTSATLTGTFSHYLNQTIAAADGLVTISRATQQAIERFCREAGVTPPPIYRVRLGDELESLSPQAIPGLIPGGYIMMLGTIELRKNPLLVYLMVKQAIREGIKLPPIILAGRPGWIPGEFNFIKNLIELDPEIGSKIQLLTDLNDAKVVWLYQNCLFSLYPSYLEGWGLPVAESLRYGKLCLPSDTSSLPEIAGELLEYCSPYDPKGWLNLVQKYLDPEVRERKERQLAAHYQPQDWDTCFAQLEAIVRQIQVEAGSIPPQTEKI